MRTGSLVMHDGPVAALPVQHLYPQAAGVSLGDLQGQDPLLTQSSSSKLRTMSEPVPLLRCAPGPSPAQRWKELKVDISSPCKPDLKQNGHCECSSDTAPGAAAVNTSEDSSLDLLRIVKHKPSAIVFCDNQVVSDVGESSSSITEEGEGDVDDDDDFPETLQYKEFLVSRRRRNLSRHRKCLRKRQDAQPSSAAASGWQKPTNEDRPESAGSQEEEETQQDNGQQVRKQHRRRV